MIKPEGRHRRAIRAAGFLPARAEKRAATSPPLRQRPEIQKEF
jgi:hypothetical protein